MSLRLFINPTPAQNAIQQIPFFRLLPPSSPFFSPLFFTFPTTKQEVAILDCSERARCCCCSRWHCSSLCQLLLVRRVLPSAPLPEDGKQTEHPTEPCAKIKAEAQLHGTFSTKQPQPSSLQSSRSFGVFFASLCTLGQSSQLF